MHLHPALKKAKPQCQLSTPKITHTRCARLPLKSQESCDHATTNRQQCRNNSARPYTNLLYLPLIQQCICYAPVHQQCGIEVVEFTGFQQNHTTCTLATGALGQILLRTQMCSFDSRENKHRSNQQRHITLVRLGSAEKLTEK